MVKGASLLEIGDLGGGKPNADETDRSVVGHGFSARWSHGVLL